jgi:hypothetical protein
LLFLLAYPFRLSLAEAVPYRGSISINTPGTPEAILAVWLPIGRQYFVCASNQKRNAA